MRLAKLVTALSTPEWFLLRRYGVPLEYCLQFRSAWWQAFDFEAVVDIGANTGQFVHLARHSFPKAHLFAFEPQAGAFRVLQERLRRDSKVELFNAGCGAVEAHRLMFTSEFTPASSLLPMGGMHKTAFPHTAAVTKETVHIVRLDNVLERYGPLGRTLIKVDVQGSEDQVIAGGTSVFSNAAAVIIELSFVPLYEEQPLFAQVSESLTALGLKPAGVLDQLLHPKTGRPLQADVIFTR